MVHVSCIETYVAMDFIMTTSGSFFSIFAFRIDYTSKAHISGYSGYISILFAPFQRKFYSLSDGINILKSFKNDL